MNDLTKENS